MLFLLCLYVTNSAVHTLLRKLRGNESKCIFIVCCTKLFIYPLWFSSILCELKLLCVAVSLLEYSFVPTYLFVLLLSNIFHFCNAKQYNYIHNVLCSCFLNQSSGEKIKTLCNYTIIVYYLHNYLYVALYLFSFHVASNYCQMSLASSLSNFL